MLYATLLVEYKAQLFNDHDNNSPTSIIILQELALMIFFFVRTYMMYAPLLGGFLGYVLWYEAFRSVFYTIS